MANTKAGRGLYDPRLIVGGTPQTETYKVSSAYATDFYPGQPICRLSTGFVRHVLATASTSTLAICAVHLPAPAGQTPDTEGNVRQDLQAYADLANTKWVCQLSDASAAGQTIVGNNAAFNSLSVVDSTRRMSSMVCWHPRTAAGPLRILEQVTTPDNDQNAVNPRVVVRFNPGYFSNDVTTGV